MFDFDSPQIKNTFETGRMEINGRTYRFHPMVHAQRKKVLGFVLQHQGELQAGGLPLGSPELDAVEAVIHSVTSCDDVILAKDSEHFEAFAEDYLEFTLSALAVVIYPFVRGRNGASPSGAGQQAPTSSRKPM
jgi:hypothetical protein